MYFLLKHNQTKAINLIRKYIELHYVVDSLMLSVDDRIIFSLLSLKVSFSSAAGFHLQKNQQKNLYLS